MKRFWVVIGSVVVMAGCGDQVGDSSHGIAASGKGFKIDRANCSSDSVDIGEIIRPIRTIPLRTGEAPNSPKLVNEKATKFSDKIEYQNIVESERVFVHCQKGDSSYVTMIEPEWLRGTSGWVGTSELREKTDLNNPYEGKISEWIMEDYPDASLINGSDQSDPTYKKFANSTRKINEQKIVAAKKVIESGKCEHVSSVLFMRHESSLDNFKFMIDCEANKRIELTSRDIESSSPIRTNDEKAIGKKEATEECKKLILAQVVHRSSVNFKDILGTSYYQAPISGNVRLTMDFDAKNGLGNSVSHKAVCIFDTDGVGELSISVM